MNKKVPPGSDTMLYSITRKNYHCEDNMNIKSALKRVLQIRGWFLYLLVLKKAVQKYGNPSELWNADNSLLYIPITRQQTSVY